MITCLRDQLKRDEGLKLQPYIDTENKCTVGYGHNLDATGETPQCITLEKAEEYLEQDMLHAMSMVNNALPWVARLDDVRKAVLYNMCFNMGIGKLLPFRRTLAYVLAGQYQAASKEMLNSLWGRQVGERANRLSKQLVTGEWQ